MLPSSRFNGLAAALALARLLDTPTTDKNNNGDRIKAMKWWNSLPGKDRYEQCKFHYPTRDHKTLTGREIQHIYQHKMK